MIKKEHFMTREDGVKLYRTYSDTDHLIRNKRTGHTYGDAIDISETEEYEEEAEHIEMEGAETYDEVLAVKSEMEDDIAKVTRKINYIGLTDNEALSVKELYPRWEDKVDMTIEEGYITLYNDSLWRARQTHTALAIYPPSMDTAALYEVIVKEHEGTESDPIPFTPPMEIFADKYYIQYDVLYKCTRDSQTALTYNLADLVGLYVEEVK